MHRPIQPGTDPTRRPGEIDHQVVQPDDFGQHGGMRLQVIPVLPAYIDDTLF
jgi:hypothetical protein